MHPKRVYLTQSLLARPYDSREWFWKIDMLLVWLQGILAAFWHTDVVKSVQARPLHTLTRAAFGAVLLWRWVCVQVSLCGMMTQHRSVSQQRAPLPWPWPWLSNGQVIWWYRCWHYFPALADWDKDYMLPSTSISRATTNLKLCLPLHAIGVSGARALTLPLSMPWFDYTPNCSLCLPLPSTEEAGEYLWHLGE